jgi:methyl coenzyme M reductase alpha subunit
MTKSLKMVLVLAVCCMGASLMSQGKTKPGPLSGTWACVAHDTDQGDISYTYTLTQDGDGVTGSFSETSDSGEKANITGGSYKNKKLNMEFEAHNGTVTITGTMAKKDVMNGTWTHSGGAEGTWECTRGASRMAAK